VHRSAYLLVSSAVAIAAAFGLSGCSHGVEIPPTTPVTLTPVAPPPPTDVPLPPPEALTDVMVRLTDPNVPTPDKLNLIQMATPADADAIDRFDKAIDQGGYRPLTFEANDVGWSAKEGGNVMVTMVIKTANPQAGEGGNFNFPMEFVANQGGWQLTRDSADMLLQYAGPAPSSTPPPEATPPPPPPAPPGP
jgi:hypothetical protein